MRYLKTVEVTSARMMRWISLIGTYTVEFTHIPGTTNIAADALSRLKGDINPLLPVDPREDWKQQYETLDLPIAGYTPWRPN